MDERELKEIRGLITAIDGKLDHWFGTDGPIWDLNGRVVKVESSAASSHKRIDRIEKSREAEKKMMNALAVKVGGVSAVLSALATIVFTRFL